MPYAPYHTTLPHLTPDNWQAACAAKREERSQRIPKEWRLQDVDESILDVTGIPETCGILTSEEIAITNEDEVDVLLSKLAKREWNAIAVTTAYCKRAAIAQQLTNCLTEIFFDRAMQRAKELDDYLVKHGKPMGALHGCPISLKDQFDIQGLELNMGYAAWLGRISKKDCALVRLLEDAGAVLYCRTNLPQTLMIGDAHNHVYGRTTNPYNIRLIPGGSSGGEGALLALKGSVLGVGTDIGGSVRIPANMCGIHSLRPSTRRIPYGDASNSMMGQNTIKSVVGPMARSLSSCRTFMKAVIDMQPSEYDASALPLPYSTTLERGVAERKQLCFGILMSDGMATPHPPVLRALKMSREALERAGHQVIDFAPPEISRTPGLSGEIYAVDGGEDYKHVMGPINEPFVEGLGFLADDDKPKPTVYDSWQLQREKEDLQNSFLQHWLDTKTQTQTGRAIDGWIAPVSVSSACLKNHNTWYNYTVIANVMDLPSAVVPITRVDPLKDPVAVDFKPLSKEDAELQGRYDPELMKEMPIGLQIMGRRWKDEEVFGLARVLLNALLPIT